MRKPVESIVVKNHDDKLFRVGLAEMNGWRPAMEDSHVIHTKDSGGLFGVFDGHGGSQCSSFVAKRMTEELEKGMPEDDAAMRSTVMQLDKEFLDSKQPSGTTGTFAIVQPEDGEGKRCHLRIGNVGDSRVLLGRANGEMVEGSGTDGGLTTDHKPDHPDERARIERTGGTVEDVQGVPRVNGDLAVSRSFGDEGHKKTGPSLEEQPVSALPEFTSLNCDTTDFLMLVCDGISEGTFPNREVISLAAAELQKSSDPGVAATAVCRMALERGSYDNLSCMIVLLGGSEESQKTSIKLIPGPFVAEGNFKKPYTAMAEHAGLSLPQALEMRYDLIQQQLAEATAADASEERGGAEAVEEMKEELKSFGYGPPADMPKGSAERTQWFDAWVQESCSEDHSSLENFLQPGVDRQALMEMAMRQGLVREQPEVRKGWRVRVGPSEQVQAEIAKNESLPQWSPEVEKVCGTEGYLKKEDPEDNTAEVHFDSSNLAIWLPRSTLTDVTLEVCSLEKLKPAVADSAIDWHDRMADTAGQTGILVHTDSSDGTSEMRFPGLNDMQTWIPSNCLTECSAEQSAAKRQRTSE
jgi:serine/threonine protein phosphatase PrpC